MSGTNVIRLISGASATFTGRAVISAGGGLRRVQTGRVQNYALGIAIGLLVMTVAYLLIVAGR